MAFSLYADVDCELWSGSATELASDRSVRGVQPSKRRRKASRREAGSLRRSPSRKQMWEGARHCRATATEKEIRFPESGESERLAKSLTSNSFQWADRFVSALNGPAQAKLAWSDNARSRVTFFSELSGSGAAEVALMAVAEALGGKVAVKHSYCADIDASCRHVLQSSCRLLICSDTPLPRLSFLVWLLLVRSRYS